MKFSSKTIKTAWAIRKQTAKELNCKTLEVVWAECLQMAEVSYESVDVETIERAYCTIALTRADGTSETKVVPNISKMTDACFARIAAANKKVGTICHGYTNVPAVVTKTLIIKQLSNGDILDEISRISNKAHRTCIMTYEMTKRAEVLSRELTARKAA
jgi:hypothetical protein